MKCIIIEDELPAQRILKSYISKLKQLELVAVYQTALEANLALSTDQIDLLFLDINLPDINGMAFIATLPNPPAIIMTTAYSNYAAESFEHWTIQDYLVKPFSFERFLKAINKVEMSSKAVESAVKTNEDVIILKIDKTLHRLFVNDIIYIESDRNYVSIVTKNGKHTYIDSLKKWKQKLPLSDFIQVHKSFIINCAEIVKISGNIVSIGNQKIPIGRKYKNSLLQKIKA
ncbi:LytR/AlgR family response regulator transcription factor [Aureibaculum conchae]|uniref:LytR/AlgR family response regulator transcription factor n=1 Tax=Aureibaculum sp. 2308TA14-22 TaxID=3108392 RepID=UPI003393C212